MLRLTSDIEHNDTLLPSDFTELAREAVHLAEKGLLDQQLSLPDQRRMTVRRFIGKFGLARLVHAQ